MAAGSGNDGAGRTAYEVTSYSSSLTAWFGRVVGAQGFAKASPLMGVNLSLAPECGSEPRGNIGLKPGVAVQNCFAIGVDARSRYSGSITTFAAGWSDYKNYWVDPLFVPEK